MKSPSSKCYMTFWDMTIYNDTLNWSDISPICELIWEHQIFRVFKINSNCNFVGLLHHPFWLYLVMARWGIHFQLFYFLLLRMTDEGSVPDMCIWSISLIKSDLKWCIHLLNFEHSSLLLFWLEEVSFLIITELDLISDFDLFPNFGGFHRTLQRVRLAYKGRLLLRTPGSVPFGTCICSNVETFFLTCHVYRPFEFRTSLGTSILPITFSVS